MQRFAATDLSPQTISNFGMGIIFEELIRKFAESSNETAGEHFTPRDIVHLHAEACSDAGDAFQSTAMRLVKDQRRVSRFIEQNMEPLGPLAGQVALYMLTVCPLISMSALQMA